MGRYIVRRLLIAIPILWGITLVTFTFAHLAPGDPVSAMINPNDPIKPGDLERRKEALGLNQPLPIQYAIWLREVATGNLGYSLVNHNPVSRLLLERVPATLMLMATAMTISVTLGVALGIYSAFNQYSKVDYLLTFMVFGGISIPSFFFALVAIYVFAFQIPIFPTRGMQNPLATMPWWLDRLWHLALPATVLGIEGVAGYLRYTRSSVLEVLRQDYVTTARAKGLGERIVRLRHVFRNALLPLVTIMGLHLPGLFGGALFIEMLFSWPGMSRLAIEATFGRDYPTIMGVALMASTLVLLANLVADICYAVVDPRIRYR